MTQQEALDILKLGHNVYLTGPAGSGKTYVLNQFINHLRSNNITVGVTASTGIAATHIGGMTLHAWSGIGILDELSPEALDSIVKKSNIKKRILDAKVLIIDEISMLHGSRLDMVEKVCRAIKSNNKPYGGLQVVLCGDLFQLPPVTKNREKETDFVFKASAWSRMNLQICYLEEQHRQEDSDLISVLNAIRSSSVEQEHFEILEQRFTKPDIENYTQLYTHNKSVDEINQDQLNSLDAKSKFFEMTSKGREHVAESMIKSCLAPQVLELKKGSEVMFVANAQGGYYVNGTLGKVIDFNEDGMPVVKTKDRIINVTEHTWKTMDNDKTIAEISQLPLRLAWAITVHKSQGMSLDAAEVDLGKSFEPGMGYVALSRVRTLDGLFIKSINNTAMMVHPEIAEYDKILKERSTTNRHQLKKLPKIAEIHQKVANALRPLEDRELDETDTKLAKKLKKWRAKEAKSQSKPAFVVLSDKSIKLIASIKPTNQQELSQISGIGPIKLEKYSDMILEIVNK